LLLKPPLSIAVLIVGGEVPARMSSNGSIGGLFEIGIDCAQAPVRVETSGSETFSTEFNASSTADEAKSLREYGLAAE
jgi:hypothetical protein